MISTHLLDNKQNKMSKVAIFLLVCSILTITTSIHLANHRSRHFPKGQQANGKADIIYYNGSIITMDSQNESPNFVAVRQGNIVGVERDFRSLREYIGPFTKVVNLHLKTLMPGIIDPHSHFGAVASLQAQGFDITPPPFGNVSSIPILLETLTNYIVAKDIPPKAVISGSGYSDLGMAERRHPTRYELDSVSTVNPIVLFHFSGHIAVANSLALKWANITEQTNVTGGIIQKFPNGTLTGVVKQRAVLNLMNFSKPFNNLTNEQINNTINTYFSCGVTTAQDMLVSKQHAKRYQNISDYMGIDINAYYLIIGPSLADLDQALALNTSKFTIQGAKFLMDGSIQGYTALLTKPYWVPMNQSNDDLTNYTYNQSRSCQTEECGINTFNHPTQIPNLFKNLISRGLDIHAHCNGDGAADNFIAGVKKAREKPARVKTARKKAQEDRISRIVMIHSQTVREDQLDKFAGLGMTPSFFPGHIYYWGDKHYQIFLGPTRANRMDPAGSALKRNLKFTLHNDSPVVPAGIFKGVNTFLKSVSAAVNRVTSSGRLLDDGTQRIPVYEALKAITINSAWQSHEESIKGSIEVGKVADLIILNKNPLKISPSDLDSLKVLATVKMGKLVFGAYE